MLTCEATKHTAKEPGCEGSKGPEEGHRFEVLDKSCPHSCETAVGLCRHIRIGSSSSSSTRGR